MSLKRLLLVVVTIIFSTQSFAQEIKNGTYYGKSLKSDVVLYIKELAGRKGSFLAVIIRDEKLGFAYIVDQFSSKKYGMTPLRPLPNGVIGSQNYNPSLILSVLDGYINIVANDSNNQEGFLSPMNFMLQNKEKSSSWIKTSSGVFSNDSDAKSASLTTQDINHEATLSVKSGILPGDYVLRESRPNLHIAYRSLLTSTGVQTNEQTNLLAFFTEDKGFLKSKQRLFLLEAPSGRVAIFEN